VHDAAGVTALDPLLRDGDVLAVWADGAAPLLATKDGKPILTLHPTDSGQEITGVLVSGLLDLLVAEHGIDDDGKVDDRYRAEGIAAMRVVLDGAPESPFDVHRGARAARLRMAESVGRAYALAPGSIEAVTGRPFVVAKILHRPGARANELLATHAAREQEARAALAQAEAARVESMRPRTVAELGLDGVAVLRRRIAAAPEPFAGAASTWGTSTELIFAWQAVRGFELPPFADSGVRSLSGDELAPLDAGAAGEMDWRVAEFVRDVRGRFGTFDTGPVTSVPPTATTVAQAKTIAKRYARGFVDAIPTLYWHQRLAVELICRGLLIAPVHAAVILYEAADAAYARSNPPLNLGPLRSLGIWGGPLGAPDQKTADALAGPDDATLRAQLGYPPLVAPSADLRTGGGFIGELCIAAATSGFVGAGALLSLPSPSTP
jgi:hypothetical protein